MLPALRACKNFKQFSWLLGYTPKTLSYILYRIPESQKYYQFPIAKRGGGVRTISAPKGPLKDVQARLTLVLTSCYEELYNTTPNKTLAHGFRPGQTIVTNASKHTKKRYVFNVDIQSFFDSINFGRIYGFFTKNSNFNLNPEVARTIARIACHENVLPQGAPTSPILSNFIGHILDIKLVRLAKRCGCTYSRYADDLTFSTNQKKFPNIIARHSFFTAGKWLPGAELIRELENCGFKPNPTKVHMKVSGSKQTVTGLIVNEKVNVDNNYYRYTRAMCHSLFTKGECFVPRYDVERDFKTLDTPTDKVRIRILGFQLSIRQRAHQFPWFFIEVKRPSKQPDFRDSEEIPLDALEGRLSYIYCIKGHRTRKNSRGKDETCGVTKLYKEFLFYRYMARQTVPAIVTEGVTDNIYFRCAIAERRTKFPEFAVEEDGKIKYKVKFFSDAFRNKELLRIQSGTDNLKGFSFNYINFVKKFNLQGFVAPVIIIVDDDQAGRSVVEATKNLHRNKPIKSNLYYLGANLYLIKIPPAPGLSETEIEDLFEQEVLEREFEGKVLNRSNKAIDSNKEYGKAIFAHRIVRANQENINFEKFDEVLIAISACSDMYKAGLAKAS